MFGGSTAGGPDLSPSGGRWTSMRTGGKEAGGTPASVAIARCRSNFFVRFRLGGNGIRCRSLLNWRRRRDLRRGRRGRGAGVRHGRRRGRLFGGNSESGYDDGRGSHRSVTEQHGTEGGATDDAGRQRGEQLRA